MMTDLFKDELMSIQPAYGKQGYYVEVPAIRFAGIYPDYTGAFSAALVAMAAHKSEAMKELQIRRAELERELKEINEKIAAGVVSDFTYEGEIKEQAGGIRRILEFFFGEYTPVKGHCRIGIKPYKDIDGDGDMDIRYSITQSRYRTLGKK